jgi:hypothetical protein
MERLVGVILPRGTRVIIISGRQDTGNWFQRLACAMAFPNF